jgi:uroporphyrinogen-III synthase
VIAAAGEAEAPRAAPPVILVTRPEAQGAPLARRLALKGWAPVLCPLTVLRIMPAAPDLTGLAGVIFTSANGVRAADLPPETRALPAWCVGPATADAAREAGFSPIIGAESGPPAGALLHLRGAHGTDALAEALIAAGFDLRAAAVYEMVALGRIAPGARDAMVSGEVRAAAFYSPRTAHLFAQSMAREPQLAAGLHRVSGAAISTTAARALADLGFARVLTAKTPDGAGMDEVIARLLVAWRRS